jgi:hypothetical protein
MGKNKIPNNFSHFSVERKEWMMSLSKTEQQAIKERKPQKREKEKEVSPDIVRRNLRMKHHALLGALATFVIRRMHTNQRQPPSRLSLSLAQVFFLAFLAAVFLVVFSARRRPLFRIVRRL